MRETIDHYDRLIDENNDPVFDPQPLKDYMDKWDGQRFVDSMNLDKAKSVLEIGVGTGRLALKVAPLCSLFVGIDVSSKTISRAIENLSSYTNVNLICDDFLLHEFKEPFDVVYSSLTFMHIKDKQIAINKVAALLKDDGLFVLSIDKNDNKYIDMGVRRIKIYPDNPCMIKKYITQANLSITSEFETDFAYVLVSKKPSPVGEGGNRRLTDEV